MEHVRASYTHWSGTEKNLEAFATLILKCDRKEYMSPNSEIDLLGKRDAARREHRRRALLERNKIIIELFISPTSTQSTEDLLMGKQDQALTAATLRRLFERFANDKPVKIVMAAAVLGDISFFKTKELAEACKLREDVIRAAKERLKYYAKTQKNPLAEAA